MFEEAMVLPSAHLRTVVTQRGDALILPLAPIGSALQTCTVAQHSGGDVLVALWHLRSNLSRRGDRRGDEKSVSWTDAAVALVAGTGGPAATVAGAAAFRCRWQSWAGPAAGKGSASVGRRSVIVI